MQTVKESRQTMASFQVDYDEEVEFAAKRKLCDYSRDRPRPCCMVASFIHPHDPYVARLEWWDLYSDEEIEAYSKPLTEKEVRRAHRACYANISYFTVRSALWFRRLKRWASWTIT